MTLRWPQRAWHIHTKFSSEIQEISWVLPQQFKRLQCWYCWWEWFLKYDTEMALSGMIYIQNLMTTGSGIWYSWYYLNGMRGYSVGVTDERHLRCMPLRWPRVYISTKFHVDWYGHSSDKVLSQKSVGITKWWVSWRTPLRWLHVAWYTYQVSWRLVQKFRQY
jgi:hypothetical protein